jgi:hypothetical protein
MLRPARLAARATSRSETRAPIFEMPDVFDPVADSA